MSSQIKSWRLVIFSAVKSVVKMPRKKVGRGPKKADPNETKLKAREKKLLYWRNHIAEKRAAEKKESLTKGKCYYYFRYC